MIDKIEAWLRALPGLESLRREALDAVPGSVGLFCQGRQVLSRSRDILGTAQCRIRLELTLAIQDPGTAVPQLLLELDALARPTAPILGENQTLDITRGRLTRDDAQGIRRYEAKITFEFTSKE